jgi:ABC-type transport system involved in cytochrome c biogenesis permease subunit
MSKNPNLFSWKQWLISVSALILGSSLSLVREYTETGEIETSSIVISFIVFTIGLVIFGMVHWWANKPEE